MSVPAGWSPDPYGRYAQRYWDGTAWTNHVVAGDGTQSTDPLGTAMGTPFAIPATAMAAPTGPAAGVATAPTGVRALLGTGGPQGFLDSFGDNARDRQGPTLAGAFGALGGLVLAGGALVAILGEDPNRGAGAVIGLVLIALAVVVRLRAAQSAADFRAATVSVLTVGIVTTTVALTGGYSPWTIGLGGLGAVAAWILPPFRGHPFLLGAGAYALITSIGSAIGNASKSDPSSWQDSGLTSSFPSIFEGFGGAARNTGLFFLFAVLILAFVVFKVDLGARPAISTPLLVAAILSSLTGVTYLGLALDNAGGYLVAAVVGTVLAVVAAHGNHRATLWFGATMAAIGLTIFVVTVAEPSTTGGAGAIGVVLGAVLAGGPRLASRIRTSPPEASSPPNE